MTDDKLPPTLSNADRHRRTLQCVRNAVRCVKAAIKEQDGLEWTGRLTEALDTLQEVEGRLPQYAAEAQARKR